MSLNPSITPRNAPRREHDAMDIAPIVGHDDILFVPHYGADASRWNAWLASRVQALEEMVTVAHFMRYHTSKLKNHYF
jgi:hypothetical protein